MLICNLIYIVTYNVIQCFPDMNECETTGMCPNGECVNGMGSYTCKCKPGFIQSPNQQVCEGKHQTCKCKPGFIQSPNQQVCEGKHKAHFTHVQANCCEVN